VSWRDETPQSVQDELDLLAHETLDQATYLLGKLRGELYPFGVRLCADGHPETLSVYPGEGEHPSVDLGMLYELATVMRDGTRAVAFVALVETSDGDAVRVELEHRNGGPALVLLLPFQTQRRKLRRVVETGELVATIGERRIWTP
jgi:hypothetical protein